MDFINRGERSGMASRSRSLREGLCGSHGAAQKARKTMVDGVSESINLLVEYCRFTTIEF